MFCWHVYYICMYEHYIYMHIYIYISNILYWYLYINRPGRSPADTAPCGAEGATAAGRDGSHDQSGSDQGRMGRSMGIMDGIYGWYLHDGMISIDSHHPIYGCHELFRRDILWNIYGMPNWYEWGIFHGWYDQRWMIWDDMKGAS